jgi:glycerol-3-phosphate dehydrogenase
VALPTYGFGLRGKLPLRVAFQLLNVLTADRNKGIENKAQHVPSPYVMSRSDFLTSFAAFEGSGLTGAGVFYDGQMLNPPRIVYSIIRSAQESGAVIANYCSAERLMVRAGRVEGVTVRDTCTGESFDVRSRIVANLTGPFAPMLNYHQFGGERLDVPLSRDLALVLNRKLLPGMGLGVQTRYRDPDAWFSRGNRHLFMMPWRDRTLVGVNSRVYEGDPYQLQVTEGEIESFIGEINEACPALRVERSDVAVVNAGLLPFGENEPGQKDLSFGKRSLLVDHAQRGGAEGLITGMSVRWTMGRLLGEKVTDLVAMKLDMPSKASETSRTAVYGGDVPDHARLLESIGKQTGGQVSEAVIRQLADTFGSVATQVLSCDDSVGVLTDEVALEAQVRFVAKNEMVVTLADIVLRRLDLGTAGKLSDQLLGDCARVAGEELNWDEVRKRTEIDRVRAGYPFAAPATQEFSGAV